MADLLFCDLRRRRPRERRFRAEIQREIDDFTDEELRARYRFRRESILFITNLVAGDISRNTRQNHALPLLHQVLISLRFCQPLQVSPLLASFGCCPHCHTNSVNRLNSISDFFHILFFFLIDDTVGKLALYQRKVFFDFFRQNGNF